MTHLSRRPRALLTALQAMTVAVALFGTWFAVMLGLFGVGGVQLIFADAGATVGAKILVVSALATVIGVSVCCYITLGSFFALLQRMKKETAFTQRNCQALGRMALCCAAAGAMLFAVMSYIAVGAFLPTRSFTDNLRPFVDAVCMLMLWPFGFGLVSLLLQGVRVLMTRAIALREEQELVV